MDIAKYAELFLTESREHLRACNTLLLEWEREPAARAPVDGLFRSIHTIKGMAATMGYAGVAGLAHRTEHLLDALRAGRVAATGDTVQLLFVAVDALTAVVEQAAAGGDDTAGDAALLRRLDAAAGSAAGDAGDGAGEAGNQRGPSGVPAGARAVTIVVRADTPMRGARALLALRRAEALGKVAALRPPAAQLDREDFSGRLTFRFEGSAADDALRTALTSAGDLESVEIAPEAEPAATTDGAARARQIRVDLRRLDTLMKQVGELVVAKNRLLELAQADPGSETAELATRMARLVTGMQSEILQARMTPVSEVFDRFPRLVRDLGRDLGKRIAFEAEGGEIELDRAVLDEVGEPLVHLIRNAADHGLESPEARIKAGKPAEGRLVLSAARERNSVALRVIDDGRGIDRTRVLEKARRLGLVDAATAALTDDELLRLVARPGFSTAEEVSGVSGRGVGIDVVATRVRSLGGALELSSEPGRGTQWTLRVPLTLAIVRALLTRVGTERYAVPLAFVAETVEFDAGAVSAVRERETLLVRDRIVPTVHLRRLVSADGPGPVTPRAPTIILEVGDRRSALVVDALLGQQDIVVEPFEVPRGTPQFFGGATILADGVPALILDAAALV